MRSTTDAEQTVRDIRRRTRKQYSAEEKIRIVLSGLRGEDSIAELCRREGIAESLYYSWSKEFLEAGKKRLSGDTARQARVGRVEVLGAAARRRVYALNRGRR
jgi:transposase